MSIDDDEQIGACQQCGMADCLCAERPAMIPPAEALEKPKYRVWTMQCPFRKTGSPVVGNMGASIKPVVIFEMATWIRLCRDIPALQTTMFEVGSYD